MACLASLAGEAATSSQEAGSAAGGLADLQGSGAPCLGCLRGEVSSHPQGPLLPPYKTPCRAARASRAGNTRAQRGQPKAWARPGRTSLSVLCNLPLLLTLAWGEPHRQLRPYLP